MIFRGCDSVYSLMTLTSSVWRATGLLIPVLVLLATGVVFAGGVCCLLDPAPVLFVAFDGGPVEDLGMPLPGAGGLGM